ncbi:MAG: Uma2 family endonuclease [Chloroflexota bacterium]
MTTEAINLEKIYTLKEFATLPDDGKRYELKDGRLCEMPPAGEDHCRIGNKLNGYLTYYVYQHKLGETYGADASFKIGDDSLSPDMAFVAAGRLTERGMAVIPLAPDLVLEVVSPGDSRPEVNKKIAKYLKAGVRLCWVIDPRKQTVQVYRWGESEPITLGLEAELDGFEVVSGFKFKVSWLFE